MSIDTWATIIVTVGVAICGGLIHGVWLLAGIKSDLHGLKDFKAESKNDRAELWRRQHQHSERISDHGERITAVETHVGMQPARVKRAT